MLPTFAMPGTIIVKDMMKCEGADIKTTSSGDVLSIDNDDSVDYSVDVELENSKYSYEVTVSSKVDNAKFSMVLVNDKGNETTVSNVTVPNTGSLDTYQVKTGKIRNKLYAGKQTLRIINKSGSCNITSIKFTNSEATGIGDVVIDNDNVGDSYNLSGQKVGTGYKGIIIRNGKKIVIK
jgi:hypothetical protein